MSEIKNGKLGLYCAEHLKRNHVMTLGFKRLGLGMVRFRVRVHSLQIVQFHKVHATLLSVNMAIDGYIQICLPKTVRK